MRQGLVIFIIYLGFVKALNNPGKLGELGEPGYDSCIIRAECIERFIRTVIYFCTILSVGTILSQFLSYILHFILLRYSVLYQSWFLDKTARWRIAWALVWSNELPSLVKAEKDILASGSKGWMYNFLPWKCQVNFKQD